MWRDWNGLMVADADFVFIAVTTVFVSLLTAVSTAQGITTTTSGKKVTKLARATLVKDRSGRGTEGHGDDKDESEGLLEHGCCCLVKLKDWIGLKRLVLEDGWMLMIENLSILPCLFYIFWGMIADV